DVDRVDVEVVVEPVGVAGQAVGRLDQAYVIDAVPLEQHAVRPDVELLESSLQHASAIHAYLVDEGHQRRVVRRELELVYVAEQAVAGLHVRDEPVSLVVDGVAALAPSLVGAAVPPREDRPAAVVLHAEVSHGTRVERAQRLAQAAPWTGSPWARTISSTGAATIAVAPIASAATPIASSA